VLLAGLQGCAAHITAGVRFDAHRRPVEMPLVSTQGSTFEVLGRRFCFARGEALQTCQAYKFSHSHVQALAARAGWLPVQLWTDAQARLGLHVLARA
jgi:L-histidine Nalpha-methyltransferase